MQNNIVNIVESVLKVKFDNLPSDTFLKNINGWDSLSHMLLISKIEELMGLELSENQISKINTIKDIIDLVNHKD
jgi:acyl carrier protein